MCLDLPTEATAAAGAPLAALDALLAFRAAVYGAFGRRADALFELVDALASAGAVASPVHLSLEPVHRRGWGSFYAALSEGAIPTEAVEALLARYPLAEAAGGPLLYGVDTSVWPRCDAETSPERGFYHHSSRHSAGQPIVAGWPWWSGGAGGAASPPPRPPRPGPPRGAAGRPAPAGTAPSSRVPIRRH